MAKVKIRKGNSVIEVELKEGWTEDDIKLLLSTGIAEEVIEEKPKKKKYKNTKIEKVETPEEDGEA